MPQYLKFHNPYLDREEEQGVIDTLRSGWLTTGKKTKYFEEMFAGYIGTKYALATNSCTSALHLALITAGVGCGDEVITTPITFPATANVIIHAGATPVFVDVSPDDFNIDVTKIEKAVTKKTKAILPVHFAGNSCDMDAIRKLARKHGLKVISDCAHSIETEYKGKKVGSLSEISAFSFYATKNITTGEGGMLTTNNSEIIREAKMLSLHGLSDGAWDRYKERGYAHYDVMCPGYKYNMSDMQASVGICQLKKIKRFLKRRKEVAQIYDNELSRINEIRLIRSNKHSRSSFHLYIIILKTENMNLARNEFLETMQKKHNIGVSVHFNPIHLYSYYRKEFGYKKGMLPVSEYFSNRIVSLPIYPKMSNEDVFRVINAVKNILQYQ